METEFDPDKRRTNLSKHGVDFLVAARVFLDPHRIDGADARHDYGEERQICVGKVDDRGIRGRLCRAAANAQNHLSKKSK